MKRILVGMVLFIVLAGSIGISASVQAQTPTPPPNIDSILSSMTPEERVGQLFLVTFTGTDTGDKSQVYDLITHHHVGGVVLLASNDNFVAAPGTVPEVHALISRLQELEYNRSLTQENDPVTGQSTDLTYVPLFIGIAYEGNELPANPILTGLTPLPSEMAIGASWNTHFATQVGAVQGRELAALGFNFFM